MRALVSAFAFMFAASLACADEPAKKALPKPLPEKLVKAWKDAGATVGWMKEDDSGILRFMEEPQAGAVPAFKFAEWKPGVVAKLPLPETAFGLDLSKTELTDSGLKDLATLRTLASLCLCETKVTEEAVEVLRKALPKCFIFNC